MKRTPKEVITKIWRVVIYPIPKASGDLIFKSRDEVVKALKQIGLSDALIWLLFLRGLIEFNMNGERLLIRLVEIVEKTRRIGGM
jgi:hypothetical protein